MIRCSHWLVVLIWGAAGWFLQDSAAAEQDLFVANNSAGFNEKILRFAPSGECLGTFVPAEALPGAVGLAFDPQGNLYVASHIDNTIRRFSPTGIDLGVFVSHGLSTPTGLAFTSQGGLVVCNYGDGSVSSFDGSGVLTARFATGLLNPIALAVDQDDNILISAPNVGIAAGVYRFSMDGTQKALVTDMGIDPRGLAFDVNGNLYVADQLNQAVQRFAPEGDFLGTFAHCGLSDPFALAFDSCGQLYVSNQADGSIHHYNSCGDDLGVFAVVPTTPANPVGLAFAPVPEPPLAALLTLGASICLRARARSQRN